MSDVSLHSVEHAKIVNVPCEQPPEYDVALCVNHFRRILNNKGKEIKKVGESSKNSKYQFHGKLTFGRKQGRFTSRRVKLSSREYGLCFSCVGSRHRATECAKNRESKITYDELCIKYDNFFYETCTTKRKMIELSKKVIELQKENMFLHLDKIFRSDVIATLEAQVQKLLESQENLMNQIHVLKANNVMYHKANWKQLLELNEANDKAIRLTIGAIKIDKMLSLGKPHGDKSGLGYVENESGSTGTKSRFVRESLPVVPKVNPSSKSRFILTCHHCGELEQIRP
ncbi:hypothetical protein D8674_026470 [Pyrus ussuriensis x Pyrus communis]|uniref:Uncharacterized protein n=1 Tax=Pyrus ussuriensis x Pyrus communis TaxID=2448454 RepID=A0A5N5I6Z8_9ROSA|nr:hypothetical protein D8674_026470 [Pyrus ussuriensis x Pyrus communis]